MGGAAFFRCGVRQLRPGIRLDPFGGIEEENHFATGVPEGFIPGGAEVVATFKTEHPRPRAGGDLAYGAKSSATPDNFCVPFFLEFFS